MTHGKLLLSIRMRVEFEANVICSGCTLCKKKHIFGDYELVSIFDLQILQSLKTRVFRVQRGERRCFLKIARFGFELCWLAQEIKTYHKLTQHDSALAPRILGYVFEETPHRVIGFIFEEVNGYRPNTLDFGICEIALQQRMIHRFMPD